LSGLLLRRIDFRSRGLRRHEILHVQFARAFRTFAVPLRLAVEGALDDRKFEDVVKSAQDAAVLVLVY
jgi:hypothetical protein